MIKKLLGVKIAKAYVFFILTGALLYFFNTLLLPEIFQFLLKLEGSFFSDIFSGKHTYDEYYYATNISKKLVWGFVRFFFWGITLLIIIQVIFSPKTYYDNYIKDIRSIHDPRYLGYVRVLLSLLLLIAIFSEDFGEFSRLPLDLYRPHGNTFTKLLYYHTDWYATFLGSEIALELFQWVLVVFLVLSMLGFFTRISMVVAFTLYLLYAAMLKDFTAFYHQDYMAFFGFFGLLFTNCGDGLSIDNYRQRKRIDKTILDPNPKYAWSVHLVWLIIACIYFNASLNKLNYSGFEWWQAVNLKNFILGDSVLKRDFAFGIGFYFLKVPDIVISLFSISVLILQSSYITVPFSPLARKVVPLGAASFHLGVFLMQNILFLTEMFLPLLFVHNILQKWMSRGISKAKEVGVNFSSFIGIRAVIVVVVMVLIIVWNRYFFIFPMSSFVMYAINNNSDKVEYIELWAYDESGEAWQTNLHEFSDFFKGQRYFNCANVKAHSMTYYKVDKLLQVLAHDYNIDKPEDKQVDKFILIEKEWYFEKDPDNPDHGEEVKRYVFYIRD